MMSSRLLFAVAVAGVFGAPDHTNLMQATRFAAANEKVSVDSAGEVSEGIDAVVGSVDTQECDDCIETCEEFMAIFGESPRDAKKCRKNCRKIGKCYTDCIPPKEENRPGPLAAAQQTSSGPAAGKLVVCGGSCNNARGLFDKVLELAGGRDDPKTKIIYIPTNWHDDRDYLYENQTVVDETFNAFQELSGWSDLAAEGRLVWVHTRDRDVANSDEFVAQFADATGIWMKGGRQWRGMDAYGGTKTEEAIKGVLSRGGVFGGTSAGASIQGDFLVRGHSQGENSNYVVVGDHQEGFGFVHNVAIDQHNTQRRRNGALLDWIEMHPEYLGIALDENTYIVIDGDELEVFGENTVEIVDATLWQDDNFCSNQGFMYVKGRPLLAHQEKFYFLKAKSLGAEFGEKYSEGEKYNIKTREVTRCWRC